VEFSRLDPSYGEYERLSAMCPEDMYNVVSPDRLTGIVPDSLLNKVNGVVLMNSASADVTVFVANMNRVDMPASAVDQEPYIAVFDHNQSSASGGVVHHGNWPERTTYPDQKFFDAIAASGIQARYPLATVPTAGSGLLRDLEGHPQASAFWAAFSALGRSR